MGTERQPLRAWFAWLCVWFALARVWWWSLYHQCSVSARTLPRPTLCGEGVGRPCRLHPSTRTQQCTAVAAGFLTASTLQWPCELPLSTFRPQRTVLRLFSLPPPLLRASALDSASVALRSASAACLAADASSASAVRCSSTTYRNLISLSDHGGRLDWLIFERRIIILSSRHAVCSCRCFCAFEADVALLSGSALRGNSCPHATPVADSRRSNASVLLEIVSVLLVAAALLSSG